MKMFKFLLSFIMLTSFIVEDEAGGGSEENEDVGDVEIPDETENTQREKVIKNDKPPEDDDSEIDKLKAEIEELKSDKEYRDNQLEVEKEIKALKNNYPDFDENKILEYLRKLEKTNPEKVEELNNPLGWENIYLKEFAAKDVKNDDVSLGRNEPFVNRSEEVLEKVKNGEMISIDDEQNLYGNLL